jgi:hypothetical protein
MIPDWLSQVVDRLACDHRNRSLSEAVRSWARELGLDVDLGDDAEGVVVHLAHRLYSGASSTHVRNRFCIFEKTLLTEADFREGMKRMDTKDVVLIALPVTAVGYARYQLTRERREAERTPPPRPTPTLAERRVLVLVVNASRSEILTALQTERRLNPSLADQLYKETQALWIGTEAEFERAPIRTWLDPARRVTQESEYDVHLVKIAVADDDEGFSRNASQVDRLDAFRRLSMSGAAVEVSERLPSEAYGTTGVYSR